MSDFDPSEFPGASSYADRHGRIRWRFRAKGRQVTLPDPADPSFAEAYAAAIEGRKPTKATVTPMPGAALPQTFAAAFRQLKMSTKWATFAPPTRKKNESLIVEFLDLRVVADNPLTWRDVPVRHLRRKHVEDLLGRFPATPHKAKHLLFAIRKLIHTAIREDWIDSDPSQYVEWRPAYKGWKPWSLDAMEKFERRWPPGTAARTCYGLALWLGNRRGDVAGLRWDQETTRRILIDGRERIIRGFDLRQGKNEARTGGKQLFVPITPMLKEILTPLPRAAGTVLVTAYGKPFSAKSLTGKMAHWTSMAGLPKGLTIHGLRKSLGRYLAEADASTRQLMDILGHDDIAHAELYSREASQVRLAVQGMDKVVKLVRKR